MLYTRFANFLKTYKTKYLTHTSDAINLAKKGYWVFRMGKYVEKQFNNLHKMIYDYAKSQYRSDFLDIWLTANCHFCLSTSTGLDDVAKTFRLPLIHTDVIPIGNIMSGKKDLIVFVASSVVKTGNLGIFIL